MGQKPKVAFICVHNSCRSQIAEALGKYLASDVFESYSAGTETVPQINQDAVRLIKQLYGIDMEQTQYSKLLNELPPVDIVITMGCRVYKALRDQLAAVLDELRRIEAGQGVNDELLDTIQMIATIMNGMQEDFAYDR